MNAPIVPPSQPYPYPQASAPPGNGLATAGMVLGIVGLVLTATVVLWFIGLVLALLAVIFGAIGLRRANETGSGRGQAVTALVLGIIALVLGIAITALVVAQA